jgi:hypothetical protein
LEIHMRKFSTGVDATFGNLRAILVDKFGPDSAPVTSITRVLALPECQALGGENAPVNAPEAEMIEIFEHMHATGSIHAGARIAQRKMDEDAARAATAAAAATATAPQIHTLLVERKEDIPAGYASVRVSPRMDEADVAAVRASVISQCPAHVTPEQANAVADGIVAKAIAAAAERRASKADPVKAAEARITALIEDIIADMVAGRPSSLSEKDARGIVDLLIEGMQADIEAEEAITRAAAAATRH